jgi:hypothetical protein
MKLPPSSILASIALAGLSSISASAILSTPTETIDDIDTGILNHPISPADPPLFRELQSSCPATCSSDLCDCVVKYGYAEPCSQQLHDVCQGNAGTIADCVDPEYVFYYQNVYCAFAACRVGGGTYENCQCKSYINFCAIYQNKPGYETDAKTLEYCSIATCCKGAADDAGKGACLKDPFKKIDSAENDANTAEEQAVEQAPPAPGATDESSEPIDMTQDSVEAEDKAPPPDGAFHAKGSVLSLAIGAVVWFAIST